MSWILFIFYSDDPQAMFAHPPLRLAIDDFLNDSRIMVVMKPGPKSDSWFAIDWGEMRRVEARSFLLGEEPYQDEAVPLRRYLDALAAQSSSQSLAPP